MPPPSRSRSAASRKTYGAQVGAASTSISTSASGEFLTLLGPSGSGKTTLLMVLAGFIRPDQGSIRFGDAEVIRLAPHKRDVGMVFQNYALFPHLDVAANIAFPLKLRRVPGAPRSSRRVEAALEMVKLAGYGARRVARALRRPAAARGARARDRVRAAHRADGRAAVGARQAAARADADRAAAAAREARHDHDLRDARPARGADDVGPRRRHRRTAG